MALASAASLGRQALEELRDGALRAHVGGPPRQELHRRRLVKLLGNDDVAGPPLFAGFAVPASVAWPRHSRRSVTTLAA